MAMARMPPLVRHCVLDGKRVRRFPELHPKLQEPERPQLGSLCTAFQQWTTVLPHQSEPFDNPAKTLSSQAPVLVRWHAVVLRLPTTPCASWTNSPGLKYVCNPSRRVTAHKSVTLPRQLLHHGHPPRQPQNTQEQGQRTPQDNKRNSRAGHLTRTSCCQRTMSHPFTRHDAQKSLRHDGAPSFHPSHCTETATPPYINHEVRKPQVTTEPSSFFHPSITEYGDRSSRRMYRTPKSRLTKQLPLTCTSRKCGAQL